MERTTYTRADYLAATPELHTGEPEGRCHCGWELNESGYCTECPLDCRRCGDSVVTERR